MIFFIFRICSYGSSRACQLRLKQAHTPSSTPIPKRGLRTLCFCVIPGVGRNRSVRGKFADSLDGGCEKLAGHEALGDLVQPLEILAQVGGGSAP